ncbi:hypothetical protein [Pseudotabrizicola algicola]|uniref:Uncharacterized protein n=1 Tax=Pseudotabrizicola algicola TaxID=2709381 RepID=A0A6B3RMD2_9RHOB|nr:hypothetical protein [Pseudotabrizicola algicola]NEX46356.1 hypothetical protein [Pseudotabrizicola algicola]
MGYSPQKTPFDLADFLSKPATPRPRKWNRLGSGQRPAAVPEATAGDTVAVEPPAKA